MDVQADLHLGIVYLLYKQVFHDAACISARIYNKYVLEIFSCVKSLFNILIFSLKVTECGF